LSDKINLFEPSEETLTEDFFKQLALLKHEALGKSLIQYLEMKILKDLQSLISVSPDDHAAIAQLQSRIDANAGLRALITVDESVYEEEDNG